MIMTIFCNSHEVASNEDVGCDHSSNNNYDYINDYSGSAEDCNIF